MKSRPILGLTMGDPAGIGPEICAAALSNPGVLERCIPVLFGDVEVIRRSNSFSSLKKKFPQSRTTARKGAGSKGRNAEPWHILSLDEWERSRAITGPAIVNCGAIDAGSIHPGEVSVACGKAGFIYIEKAIKSALRGWIAGVVTAPIHKEALQLAGVRYPGHTEIFTSLTRAKRSCMMLYSDVLTVSMVTTHIGFTEIPQQLSVARVLDVIQLTSDALSRMLGKRPRLGICGLNPHAGEHGLFGRHEEERFVEPAVARAKRQGILIEGPLTPDSAFTAGQRKRFDGMVTLYHDQGHIPFKMLAFDTGVNITLGLPIVRTSVDHGTAFDIAWKGLADPGSLFAAIRVAADLSAANARKKRS